MKSYAPKQTVGPAILIIGYGNDLRGDDGLGPAVAAQVETHAWPGVRVLCCHQLTPELAAAMAGVDKVIFVDAEQNDEGGVRVREVKVSLPAPVMTHVSEPQALLELTRLAYDHCPAAWWVTIPGVCFALGTSLSPETRPNVESAIEKIRELCLGKAGDPIGQND